MDLPHWALYAALTPLVVTAAARSTWSPCGLSMLSSITPLGEAGRGHRFRSTASWYVAGAVLGGACTGAVMAAGAYAVARAGLTGREISVAVAVVCLAAFLLDAGVLGPRIPLLRRQVNEVWLDQFRSWVYGGGFGWQIGTGFTTYIMSAAVIALVPLAALTGAPIVAFGVGAAFGTLRGLTVLMGRSVDSPAALRDAHRRLDRWEQAVRSVVIAVLAAVSTGFATIAFGPVAGGVVLVVAGAVMARGALARGARRSTPAGA